MDVSIIIVNYNTKDLTVQCIKSIVTYTKEIKYEIIVVDNASSDGTVEYIQEVYSEVITIRNSVNIGFGAANNLGCSIAKGEFIFLLNSDTYLISNSVKDFHTFMKEQRNAKVAVCGGCLLNDKFEPAISYGNFPSIAEIIYSMGLSSIWPQYFENQLASAIVCRVEGERAVDFISGADMFIRRMVYTKIKGFDEDFFLYCEEVELSFRIKSYGYSSVLLPSVKIVHLEGGSQSKKEGFNEAKFKIAMDSRLLLYKKCYGRSVAGCAKALYLARTLGEMVVSYKTAIKKFKAVWSIEV